MKITVFTSNQPRHSSLIRDLASRATEVFAVQECSTLFPGEVADFYAKSDVMQRYFSKVIEAEREVFGRVQFTPPNVRVMPVKMGDLKFLCLDALKPALHSDLYVVFGASFIKPPLVDVLIDRQAINIHMGVSPYYRGTACNFWAIYDGNADLVGATIHRLSRGLDSGDMIFHAFPAQRPTDPFLLGMLAVRAAHRGLIEKLTTGELFSVAPESQDRAQQIRYSRNKEFTDAIAARYLSREMGVESIGKLLKAAPSREFVRPFFDGEALESGRGRVLESR